MTFTIMPIVEGDGEVKALPVLLRRICGEVYDFWGVTVRTPWRLPRGKMVKSHEIGRVYTALASGAASGNAGILVLLDQDDDVDAAVLAAQVAEPMQGRAPLEVIVAAREFEAWFLGSIESLRGHGSVRPDAAYDGDPEAPRDAKGRLESRMTESYRETLHQTIFASLMSIDQSRASCPSFEVLVRAVGRLIGKRDQSKTDT
jgi:hypothetical protein